MAWLVWRCSLSVCVRFIKGWWGYIYIYMVICVLGGSSLYWLWLRGQHSAIAYMKGVAKQQRVCVRCQIGVYIL